MLQSWAELKKKEKWQKKKERLLNIKEEMKRASKYLPSEN